MAQNDLNNKPAGPKSAPPAGRFGLIFFLVILAVFLVMLFSGTGAKTGAETVSYTHLRAHETVLDLVCRLLLEKKKKT